MPQAFNIEHDGGFRLVAGQTARAGTAAAAQPAGVKPPFSVPAAS